jgi:hypothetical protein
MNDAIIYWSDWHIKGLTIKFDGRGESYFTCYFKPKPLSPADYIKWAGDYKSLVGFLAYCKVSDFLPPDFGIMKRHYGSATHTLLSELVSRIKPIPCKELQVIFEEAGGRRYNNALLIMPKLTL